MSAILWPFRMLWRGATAVLKLTGRLICLLLGFALMAVGAALALSVVGLPLGVPVAALGFLLLIRALF